MARWCWKISGQASGTIHMPPDATAPPPELWQIAGRVHGPLPADWRADLARRLGHKPRRLGPWAESALHGALRCLESAGESTLPADAALLVCSLSGPVQALHTALAALQQGQLPLPYTFLQSQPAVMLAALATHLGWSGDAQALNTRNPIALLRLALLAPPPGGLLLGWVEDERNNDAATSHWLRLRPVASTLASAPAPALSDLSAAQLWSGDLTHLRRG